MLKFYPCSKLKVFCVNGLGCEQKKLVFQCQQTFEGNNEAYDTKHNIFFPPLIGRYVRLHPSHSYNYPTVRLEYFGCELDGMDKIQRDFVSPYCLIRHNKVQIHCTKPPHCAGRLLCAIGNGKWLN